MQFCITTILFITTTISKLTNADECKTPNNEEARCISIYSCPILLNLFADPASREFIRQSSCGGTPTDPKVCCGTQSNFTSSAPTPNSQTSLLPSSKHCGLQHSDDYFHTITDTSITEFPWVVAVLYEFYGQEGPFTDYMCTGTLINTRYVLTSGVCFNGIGISKQVSIRLGEYDIKNATDCVEDSYVYECSQPVIDYAIERLLLHPNHTKPEFPSNFGIALVRLNETVEYSDYVRPICLPLPGEKKANIGDLVITSGWGRLRPLDRYFKKKVYNTLISHDGCKKELSEQNDIALALLKQYGCAVTVNGSESVCDNDRGGGVMYTHGHKWFFDGIIVSPFCEVGVPYLYLRVEYFLDWIIESLEP